MRGQWDVCPECGDAVEPERMEAHTENVHADDPATRARWPWIVSGIFVAIVIAFLLVRAGQPTPADIDAQGEPYFGDPDAPTEVFLYADHQCTECRAYILGGRFDAFLEEYVETGQVRVVWKDNVLHGEEATLTAEASNIVWDMAPEDWADWTRLVFQHQEDNAATRIDRSTLVTLAEDFGRFDVATFEDRLDRQEFRGEVLEDREEARELGLDRAPALLVDGTTYRTDDRSAETAVARLVADQDA